MPSRREARVLFGFHDGTLFALTAFIKKTQATPPGELALAQQRLKEAMAPDDQESHIGSSFESWLDEKGMREEVTAAAVKSVIADQIAAAMKERGLTKSRMAELMHTSRAQVDRLLDPSSEA